MAKCQRCLRREAHDFRHGSASGYHYHQCRCSDCLGYVRNRVDPGKRDRDSQYRQRHRVEIAKRQRERYRSDPQAWREKYTHPDRERGRRVAYKTRRVEVEQERRLRSGPRPRGAFESKAFKTIEAARNSRRPWTTTEDSIATSPLPILEIAYLLGRTYGAVVRRRSQLRQLCQEQAA